LVLGPGAQTTLKLVLKAPSRRGKLVRHIRLLLADHAALEIPVTATIHPLFTSTPKHVRFGAVKRGTKETIQLRFETSAHGEVNFVSPASYITVSFEEAGASGDGRRTYAVGVELGGDAPLGALMKPIQVRIGERTGSIPLFLSVTEPEDTRAAS